MLMSMADDALPGRERTMEALVGDKAISYRKRRTPEDFKLSLIRVDKELMLGDPLSSRDSDGNAVGFRFWVLHLERLVDADEHLGIVQRINGVPLKDRVPS
jgi:hypothetical protein